MRKIILAGLLLFMTGTAFGFEAIPLWPNRAPDDEKNQLSAPSMELWIPAYQTSDSCVIVCPGGAYLGLQYIHEGAKIAEYFNSMGIRAVVLKYRTRRPDQPIYQAAWQDEQRCVRIVRSHATEWKINPEKIGMIGFSAGGHLTLLGAVSSQTPAYPAIDDIDRIPSHINFAIAVYPAYVLDDGKRDANTNRGHNANINPEFKLDDKSCPTIFLHGDEDVFSPMGSVMMYSALRERKVPCELHIYAKTNHGFGNARYGKNHVDTWRDRIYSWLSIMGFIAPY